MTLPEKNIWYRYELSEQTNEFTKSNFKYKLSERLARPNNIRVLVDIRVTNNFILDVYKPLIVLNCCHQSYHTW